MTAHRSNPLPTLGRALAAAALLLAGTLSTGCASDRAALDNPQPVAADAYPDVFARTVDVLRRQGFEIDRKDLRFGQITSLPKGSPTAFEPWIADNSTPGQAWQSTLGDLRRIVKISFEPAEATPVNSVVADEADDDSASSSSAALGPYQVHVEVQLEQRQVTGRRLDGRTRGSVFADLAEPPQSLQDRGIDAQYWQPIGRDTPLEQRLLQAIFDGHAG